MPKITLEKRLEQDAKFELWEILKDLTPVQRAEKLKKLFWKKYQKLACPKVTTTELSYVLDLYYWALTETDQQCKNLAKCVYKIYEEMHHYASPERFHRNRNYIKTDDSLIGQVIGYMCELWKLAKSEEHAREIFGLLLSVNKFDLEIRDEKIKLITDHHFPFDRAGAAIRQAFQTQDFDQYKNLWKHLFNAWYRNTSLDHIPGIIEAVLPIQKALKASGLGMELRNHAPLLDWLEGQAEFVSKQYALVCLFIERAQSGSTTRGRKLQPCVGDFRISYLNDPFRVNIEYRLEPEMVPVPDDAELNKVMTALLESDLDTLLAHMNDFEEKYNVNFVLHCPQLSKF